MKLNKKLLLLFLLILIIILLIFLKENDSNKENVVNFGYSYNSGQIPGLIGVEKSFFKNNGLEIKSVILKGGKEVIEAMLAREIDIGLSSSSNIIPASSKTDKIIIIASTSYGGGRKRLMIREDLEITNFNDLKNKKIAVRVASTQYKNLLKLIEEYNLTKSDFQILNMKGEDAIFALKTKDVDSYLCGEPDCATIEYNKIGYELLNFDKKETDPNFLIVRREFLENNPNLVIKFVKGWSDTIEYVNNNLEESKKIFSDKSDVNLEIVEISTKYITYDYQLYDFIISSFKEDSEFLLNQGEIDKLPNFDKIIILDYVNKII